MDVSNLDPAILATIPAVQPPPGVTPNFVNPDSLDSMAQITVCVALPITFVILLLRLYVRVRVQRSWGADDYLAIVSMVCLTAFCVLFLIITNGPLGEHTWDVPISRLGVSYSKCNLASQCLYALSALFVKATLLVFYLRVFSPLPYAQKMIWLGIAFTVAVYVGTAMASVILYVPRHGGEKGWMAPKPDAVMEALLAIPAAQGVIGIATDFYVLCIPIHLVAGLHLPLGRKIGVVCVFLSGFLACICAIIGSVYRFKAKSSRDPLWMSVPSYSLAVIELCVGIICACLPILLVLAKQVAKNDSYIKMVQYFRSLTVTKKSEMESEEKLGSYKIQHKIPKPIITGLRSFMDRHRRSGSDTITNADETYTLDSIDDDYHAQLKDGKTKR